MALVGKNLTIATFEQQFINRQKLDGGYFPTNLGIANSMINANLQVTTSTLLDSLVVSLFLKFPRGVVFELGRYWVLDWI